MDFSVYKYSYSALEESLTLSFLGAAVSAIFCKSVLIDDGWRHNVGIHVENGKIKDIQFNADNTEFDLSYTVVVPGMSNLHSHAFQRGMAGLAEVRGPASDSFWSWRKVMYDFALTTTPDDIEAIASQLYVEMLEAGFTRVGEFHYLHHDKAGSRYSNIAEMAERVASATSATGISLTLLPVFYAHSGFGGTDPSMDQRRFINSIDTYSDLMEACHKITGALEGATIGIAPHSLRAVTPEELKRILPLSNGGPIHIHIAEQEKEVRDCIEWSGSRPVDWLLSNAPVSENWTLIHATHMTESEALSVAKKGAIAGLCPITEANLGDGTFPAPSFIGYGGSYGIGSDSNILISVSQELRQLEYSRRLFGQSRNVIAKAGQSTGHRLFTDAIAGGSKSLHGTKGIRVGEDADLVALDPNSVPYLDIAQILDQWIFAAGIGVDSVWVRGKQVVQNGKHLHRRKIEERFKMTMQSLMKRL